MVDFKLEGLARYAHKTEDGRWWFSSPVHTHSEETALKIVECCVTLGVQVTDVITTEAWFAMVSRIVKLDQQLLHYMGG